jgi:Fe-Mn family superoxide dismutase
MSDRRSFLKTSALFSFAGLATNLIGKNNIDTMERVSGLITSPESAGSTLFTLPKLPYAYNAMEPFIDKQTMEIHYTKHHQGYVDKLNTVTEAEMDFKMDDATKCKNVSQLTPALIRNNLGGHYNHTFFWESLKPNPDKKENLPAGKLHEAITRDFKSFDNFKTEFSSNAAKVFGSGWCWLIFDERNNLKITTTPNQDNPLMLVATDRGTPVLGLDVWEHAYYLKYQNKRADYISNWWNVVNWDKAEQLFTQK